MNEFGLKLMSDFINEWDSSSADYFLCWAAAEHTGMPGVQRQSPDALCCRGYLGKSGPETFAK